MTLDASKMISLLSESSKRKSDIKDQLRISSEKLNEAILSAHLIGIPNAEIASAVGVTRQMIEKTIKNDGPEAIRRIFGDAGINSDGLSDDMIRGIAKIIFAPEADRTEAERRLLSSIKSVGA